MTPANIMAGMREKNQELSMKNVEYIRLNDAMAQAEMDYNIAYAEKLLQLKMAGEAITISKDMAKGDKAVAKLRYAYIGAEGAFNACRERIKDLRSAVDTYRSLLTWMRAEMEMAGKIPER